MAGDSITDPDFKSCRGRQSRSRCAFIRRPISSVLTNLTIGLLITSGAGCGSKPAPPGPLAIAFSGDTAGWIVPCGCTSNQSGGLARRATFLHALSKDRPVLVADVGGAAAGTSLYDRAKFEAILTGELRLGLAAHNLGLSEVKLGAEYLREVAARLKAPFVNCNAKDESGQPIVNSHVIVNAANRRVAFVGVLSGAQSVPHLQIENPKVAVLRLLPSLKGQYDHLIILAYVNEMELRDLAAGLPEADAVIGGPTGQCIAPTKTGSRWLASVTNKGKFVCTLSAKEGQSGWDGAIEEMTESYKDDSEQVDNVGAFHKLLAERDFTAEQTSFVNQALQSISAKHNFVGSDRCRDCHRSACEKWRNSGHASAWASLTKTNSQVDSYCQQCHTTGFGLAGGFESAGRSLQRVSVGCEECHGAGSAHVVEPTVRTLNYQQAKYRCQRCHDRENSPRFTFEEYWPRIAHEGADQ